MYLFFSFLQLCTPRVLPSSPEEHYRAVCRALATESSELRVFLSRVFTNDAEALRIKADAQSSRQELANLAFSDWVCFVDSFMIKVQYQFTSQILSFSVTKRRLIIAIQNFFL
jgi:hypothetical protein